jgi:hypothetical protein
MLDGRDHHPHMGRKAARTQMRVNERRVMGVGDDAKAKTRR